MTGLKETNDLAFRKTLLFSVIVSENLTILYKEPSIRCFTCISKQHQRLLIAHTNRTLKITMLVLGQ